MKKGLTVAGLAGAILFSQAQPVHAINKEWSAVAGFVGGLLVANAANCNTRSDRSAVYHQPAQRTVYQPVRTTVVYQEPVRTGYYTWRTQRVWNPGCWVYEDTGCGTVRNVWSPGHYTLKRYRVWVDTTCRTEW